MKRLIMGVLFLFVLWGSVAETKPNLFDPVEETGILVFEEGGFYVNGMELKLGSQQVVAEDYDEDGVVSAIWYELWNMRGQKVTVAGYRDHSPENYDEMYVIFINGKYYPNPRL